MITPNCCCCSAVSCNSRVNEDTNWSRVGCPGMLTFPETRWLHRCVATPPSNAPSKNTTITRTAASLRVLVFCMAFFRHQDQSFVPVGWRSRIIGKQPGHFVRRHDRELILGLAVALLPRVESHQHHQRQRRRGRKLPG